MPLAAVAQLCSRSNVAHNLTKCCDLIARAGRSGAQLLWLPEASDFIAGPADDSRIWVGVGVHESVEGDERRCFNTNLLISPAGDIVQAYRKLHLFDVDIKGGATILESNTTVPGDELLPPVGTPLGQIGLLTCYDIRFPEVSLSLRRAGAEILTFPSAFTLRTGAAHWEVLLRARAIETQCYVLAPAQAGAHSATRASYGHAMIVDPWGTVVAQAPDRQPKEDDNDDPTFVMADIDLSWLKSVRQDMPLWQQRRTGENGGKAIYPAL